MMTVPRDVFCRVRWSIEWVMVVMVLGLVKLNVGGTVFTATLDTLCRTKHVEETFFSGLFRGMDDE